MMQPHEITVKTVNTGIKLDTGLHQRLKMLGQLKDRTPHWLMKVAIEEYVTREEVMERERQEDSERWQRYQRSNHAIPHAKVEEWLASWGSGDELPCPK